MVNGTWLITYGSSISHLNKGAIKLLCSPQKKPNILRSQPATLKTNKHATITGMRRVLMNVKSQSAKEALIQNKI